MGQTRFWGGRGTMFSVAVVTAFALFFAVTAAASPTDPTSLEGECINAAIARPEIGKVSIRHAGAHKQSITLTANYVAMPDACHDDDIFRKITDDIYRENSAQPQVLYQGKWRWVNDWWALFGGVVEGDPSGKTTWSNVNNQVAFKGEYFSPPAQAFKPTRFSSCRVRILLQETAIRPHPLGYKGRKPPPVFATKVYPVEVPVASISPHTGMACSLLVGALGANGPS